MEELIEIQAKFVLPDLSLPGDIYILMSTGHKKYRNRGDTIDQQTYKRFMEKGVKVFFVERETHPLFLKWAKEIAEKEKASIIKKIGVENQALAESHFEIKNELELFMDLDEVNKENAQNIQNKARRVTSVLKENPHAQKVVNLLCSYDNRAIDHSLNVANLATYIAMTTGYNQAIILETAYLGGLLHDFGKTRIKLDDYEKDSPEYIKAYQSHPTVGKMALMASETFSDEVLRIIEEHHEYINGSGYPKKLAKTKIYELTKIITVANEMDQLVSKMTTGNLKQRQHEAMKIIAEDLKNGREDRKFDPVFLEKCVKIFGIEK